MMAFLRANTAVGHAPLAPGIVLHLASAITPIWQATEAWLEQANVGPPYWAFAWPGSQALARHVIDNPQLVAGRRVLDFAAGCGLAGIACAKSGAAAVEAAEIDPMAIAAIEANAALNAVRIERFCGDLVGAACRWDLIMCGDVCYEAPMARRILPWLRTMAERAEVWLAEPGRAYEPQDGCETIATYVVPTSLELEDRVERVTRVLRIGPEAQSD